MKNIKDSRTSFWMKLFPKLEQENELNNILLRGSGLTLEELEKEYKESIKKI